MMCDRERERVHSPLKFPCVEFCEGKFAKTENELNTHGVWESVTYYRDKYSLEIKVVKRVREIGLSKYPKIKIKCDLCAE